MVEHSTYLSIVWWSTSLVSSKFFCIFIIWSALAGSWYLANIVSNAGHTIASFLTSVFHVGIAASNSSMILPSRENATRGGYSESKVTIMINMMMIMIIIIMMTMMMIMIMIMIMIMMMMMMMICTCICTCMYVIIYYYYYYYNYSTVPASANCLTYVCTYYICTSAILGLGGVLNNKYSSSIKYMNTN